MSKCLEQCPPWLHPLPVCLSPALLLSLTLHSLNPPVLSTKVTTNRPWPVVKRCSIASHWTQQQNL